MAREGAREGYDIEFTWRKQCHWKCQTCSTMIKTLGVLDVPYYNVGQVGKKIGRKSYKKNMLLGFSSLFENVIQFSGRDRYFRVWPIAISLPSSFTFLTLSDILFMHLGLCWDVRVWENNYVSVFYLPKLSLMWFL